MEAIIKAFLDLGSGYGSGDGSGSGNGYSSGDGSGSGYGYGYGSGDGYGNGYGNGSGNGYGSGSGFGDGYGYGSDDGYGYGSDFGIRAFNSQAVYMVDDIPTLIDRVHGSVARGRILQRDLQTAPCFIVKGGGFFAHGETLREAQQALEEKIMDTMPVEQKIREFKKRFQPGRIYPAQDFYNWHHFLTGSCEMGRREFARDHDINIETDTMTPERFMTLTKDAFGGSVIRQLMEEWEHEHR